jgi:hypothetical protein
LIQQPTISIRSARDLNAFIAYHGATEYKLAPGLWDLTEQIVLPAFASLIGSGRRATLLRGRAGYSGTLISIPSGQNQAVSNLGYSLVDWMNLGRFGLY